MSVKPALPGLEEGRADIAFWPFCMAGPNLV